MASGGKVSLGFGGKVNVGTGGKVNLGFGGKTQVGSPGGKIRVSGPAAVAAQHPSHGGGGFLGDIGHWVASKASLAGHDLAALPGGTYHLVKAALPSAQDFEHPLRFNAHSAGQQWGEFITHPVRSYQDTAKGRYGKDAQGAARQFGGLAQGVEQSIRHPLRDPFQTLLTVGPALHIPFRAGEIAARVDTEAPRMLKTAEGKRFSLSPPSKSAPGRMGQRVYDRALERAMRKNPEGRVAGHAQARIGKQILESSRPKQMMRTTEADVLQRAGRKLSRQEQAALRLTSENVTPTEARLFHEQQAAKGINVAKHQEWAKTYRQIEQKQMLTQDAHGNVIVNAKLHPRLAAVDQRLAEVQRQGEQIIREHGLMTPEGAQQRLNAPGQQIRGALTEEQRQRGIFNPQGRGFVTEKALENKAPKTGVARASSPVVGEVRKPITAQARTGLGRALGEIPDNTTRLVAQNLRTLQRYLNTDELRKRWLETGSDVRRTSRDILVREPGTKKGEIPAKIEDLLGRKKLTYDELTAAREGAHEGLRAHLEETIPGLRDKFAADKQNMIGEKAPAEYKWVDQNVVGDYANSFSGSRGAIGKKFDNLNSAITAATVYYKIGHIGTRVFTNAATNLIQGSANPLEIAKSFKLFKALTEKERREAWAAAGQHGFMAMPHEGTGKLGAVATRGAQFWAHRADAMFRFNSIAFEARRAGIKTPAEFRALLEKAKNPEGLSPGDRARVENILKRANREAIAYDRLSDSERRFIGRAFWFYPWVKGSVTFAGRTFVEHPGKAYILGNAGVQARQQQEKALGAIPSYEFGLLPIGPQNAQGNVPTTNLETFSPFSTLGNLLQIPEYQAAAGNLNPGAAALLSLLTRTNQYGQHSNAPVSDALQALLAASPEFQIAAAAGGHKSKMFPQTDWQQQVLRMLVGPAWRRYVNVADLNKAAGYEQTGR